MQRLGTRLADFLTGAAGALLTSQFPAFYGQYLQSLGGRLDQARLQAERLRDVAASLDLPLELYLQRLLTNSDAAIQFSGRLHAEILKDEARLTQAFRQLSEAAFWERPLVFARNFELAIGQGTAERFQPAFPITLEGFAYTGLGLLLGLGVLYGSKKAVAQLRSTKVRNPA
ncbi:DUF2937 family protein [Limibacillus sp. MBR-115]|jgi:hypothetical protein|uniref:DUF2937 family protein n=1 Tax=Limibacillus sp. MBR-115 TaxID=3156465 RepID=UPI00339510D2